jgi:hypothetical protein
MPVKGREVFIIFATSSQRKQGPDLRGGRNGLFASCFLSLLTSMV